MTLVKLKAYLSRFSMNFVILKIIIIESEILAITPGRLRIVRRLSSISPFSLRLSQSHFFFVYQVMFIISIISAIGHYVFHIIIESDGEIGVVNGLFSIMMTITANCLALTLIIIIPLKGKEASTLLKLWDNFVTKKDQLNAILQKQPHLHDSLEKLTKNDYGKCRMLFVLCCTAFVLCTVVICELVSWGFESALTYILNATVASFVLIQYSIICVFLTGQVHVINEMMVSLGKSLITDPLVDATTLTCIGITIKARRILCNIIVRVDELYGLVILLAILRCFITFMITGHYLIPRLYRHEYKQMIDMVSDMFCSFLPFWTFGNLCSAAQTLTDEIRRTRHVVTHVLSRHLLRFSQRQLLRNFSMELLHENITMTAYGIVAIDIRLIFVILNAVSVYQVFWLQSKSAGIPSNVTVSTSVVENFSETSINRQ